MKVPIEDEQKIRNIGKDLNKRISEIKSQMNIDDLQDIFEQRKHRAAAATPLNIEH